MQTSALTLLQDRPQKAIGESYLKFEIGQGIPVMFGMKQVQEVLVLSPQRLTPMPNMPACILGLTNRRSRVLWVADLANLLEVGALDSSPQQYDLVILKSSAGSIAVAVKQVNGLLWVNPESVQPPPEHIAVSLIPFLRGCVLQGQELLLVLDAESILQSAIFQGQ
ncbi:chemotaxis protein CheW [Phormidesmis sp. 146-35]